MKIKFLTVFCILLTILITTFASAFADEINTVKQAFLRQQSSKDKVSIYKTRVSVKWALLHYTVKSQSGYSYRGAALMHNSGGKWQVHSNSGVGPTTDLLSGAGVPKSSWEKLLDSQWIEISKPVLNAIHKKLGKNYSVLSARVVSNWALCEWSLTVDGEIEAEGQALLKKVNGRWAVKESGGGAMGSQILKEKGVPEKYVKTLLGK